MDEKEIKFELFEPGGNLTAVVVDQSIADYAHTAKQIMTTYPNVEQVGFLRTSPEPTLVMMGGELCINAIASVAFLCTTKNKKTNCTIKSAGLKVKANIQNGLVELLLPLDLITATTDTSSGFIVKMNGIAYLLTETKRKQIDLRVETKKIKSPALGLISYNTKAGVIKINPLIYVKATDTLIKESACGSGSIACAHIMRAQDPKRTMFEIKQPSGAVYKILFDEKTIRFKTPVEYKGKLKVKI